jgi:agmatinase
MVGGEPPQKIDALLEDGARTFYGVPASADLDALDAEVAFVGVPFDAGTPQPGNRTGQRGGPAAARAASHEQFDYLGPSGAGGWFDIETGREHLLGVTMADLGDVLIQGADEAHNFARMTEVARRVAEQGSLLVSVGGDHCISFPLGRGVSEAEPVAFVHVDAHADFLDELDGVRFTGASQLRRLAELPSIQRVSALGLRNVARPEVDGMRELGVGWATTLDLIERGADDVVSELVPGDLPLYVSVDLDVLDLSLVPGTTLPEPGGLSYRQLRDTLAAVARQGRVVAIDVAELNPPYDQSSTTARLATWIVTHLLAEVFDHGGNGAPRSR